MQTIRRHLDANLRYLVIELITGVTRLLRANEVFQRPSGPGFVQFVVVDLQVIYERFEREAMPQEAFTLSEVAVMAQQKGPTLHSWIKAGVLTPSIRDRDGTQGRAMLFSRLDAFLACLVASLKRKCGLRLPLLRQVGAVIRADREVRRPRTARGVRASGSAKTRSRKPKATGAVR